MKDIREMIDRYLDERMSHDEEQEFFRYLRSAELPEEFHEERELILQMAAMQEPPPPPAGMEERLTAMIDNLAQESDAPVKRVFTLKLRHVWRAAAIVIIMLGGIFAAMWQKSYEEELLLAQETDTFATPEEALPHANAILRDIAMAVNITHNNAAKLEEDIILLNNIMNK
jgi:anti-sigma factor RsiW